MQEMLAAFRRQLSGLATQELLATAISYVGALSRSCEPWTTGDLPPGFWLWLAVLSIPVLTWHGIVAPVREYRHHEQERRRKILHNALLQVRWLRDGPGEELAMASADQVAAMIGRVQDAVDAATALLDNLRVKHPPRVRTEDNDSLRQWHEFLREERWRLVSSDEDVS